jgi:hypothetical protein
MGAMIGVVIGYMLGTRAGADGWKEVRSSWATIRSSEEVRDTLAGGVSMVGSVLQRGSAKLADRLQGADTNTLRRVA